MAPCETCKIYTGLTVVHTVCPLASSMTCHCCFQRGHMSAQCTDGIIEHPACLEDCIPIDVRNRWGIHTVTPLVIQAGHDPEKKIADINTIVIPDDYTDLKEFIREHKIRVEKVTKESAANCIKAIKAWAISRGYRAIMNHTIPTIATE